MRAFPFRRLPAMPHLAVLLLLLLVASASFARPDPSGLLSLEALGATTDKPFGGWWDPGDGSLHLDSTVVHSGRYSMRIERDSTTAAKFSSTAIDVPVDFPGDSVEWRGWLRLENVKGWAALWQRQDGRNGGLQFDNMYKSELHGTQDWREFRIVLPRDSAARRVYFGALLVGTGRVWVDDMQALVDGRPIAQAPEIVMPKTVFDTDTAFVRGSRITDSTLTRQQAENIALLGKVWGFLKYHHPDVVAGRRHWDFDLFRVMPRVLAARDRREACDVMARWVDSLGVPPPCDSCAQLPAGRPMAPRLAWASDRAKLGDALSRSLVTIHARRPKVKEQYFVSFHAFVGNPDFGNELAYSRFQAPDAGYRLLALFRFWNMVEYWFPYRDVMGEDWDATLREFVPRLAGATTRDAYATEMMALIARVHDTHANLWSSLDVRPPIGKAYVPARTRFVEGRAMVTGWTNPRLGPASGLAIGDVIESIGGESVAKLVNRWRPMYAASNEPTRLRDVGEQLTRGEPGPVKLGITRDGRRREIEVVRVPQDSVDVYGGRTHDHPGPAFRRLSADVAYLRLGPAKRDSIEQYFERAKGARLLVLDHRNYPSDFPIFQIGGHLVSDSTAFVKFTIGDATNPGSFAFGPPLSLAPIAPRFDGAVVILVDEITQSSAEYHSLAFRSAPRSLVVGSTTAGADGNISQIALPGGLRTIFSGIGVFWPDGRPTQRVGIVPDLVATPTIAGLKAGRDEVLDAALKRTLGRTTTAAEYEALRAP